MNVLVGCEVTGAIRDAFRARGHEAWSCDLKGPDDLPEVFRAQRYPNYHLEGDVRDFLQHAPGGASWDLFIAHPDCTYLCASGLHWNRRRPGRAAQTEAALAFVQELMAAPIPRIAIENPIGCIGTRIRKADQIIQPWQFGHDASKATCLWLKGLPRLKPTALVPPRFVGGKPRWGNQTDSGQNRLGPSPIRAALRAATYEGLAAAMAYQWGSV